MRTNAKHAVLMLSLGAALAVTGCKKAKERTETATAPAESTSPSTKREPSKPLTASPSRTSGPTAEARVEVDKVELGTAISSNKQIMGERETFRPTDTIYAAVKTKGSAPEATLTARWTYEGDQLINESTQRISPNGPAATEFHIEKPGGWPEGNYKLEISLNGDEVVTKDFKVGAA